MPQFTVHRNRSRRSRSRIPYLLDVQNDLYRDLATRLVIPLYLEKSSGLKPLTHLTPRMIIEGKACLMMTPQLAGVPARELGEEVADLSQGRNEILRAIDLLVTGF